MNEGNPVKALLAIPVILLSACGGGGQTNSSSSSFSSNSSSAEMSSSAPTNHIITVRDMQDGKNVTFEISATSEGFTDIYPASLLQSTPSFDTDCTAAIEKEEEEGERYNLDNSQLTGDCQIEISYLTKLTHSHILRVEKHGDGGTIDTNPISVQDGQAIQLTYEPHHGYSAAITGCGGQQDGSVYKIQSVMQDCTVTAVFQSNSEIHPVASIKGVVGVGALAGKEQPTLKISFQGAITQNKPKVWLETEHGKARIYEGDTVAVESESTLIFENAFDQEYIGVVGCEGEWNPNALTLALPKIDNDCEVIVDVDQTENRSRFINIETEVHPLNAGYIEPQMVQVFVGTRFQTNVITNPGFRLKSIEGCVSKEFEKTDLAKEIVTTPTIHERCKMSAYFMEIDRPSPTPPTLIAHAGGGFNGQRYRNSMEAMNKNYELGHRYFEVDFSWTADHRLVAIHDWDGIYRLLFPGANHEHPPTYAEFVGLEMANRQTQMTLERINQWLDDHPDAFLVTDIKDRNLDGLAAMKAALGENAFRVIPQMYHTHEYDRIRELGYHNIIFTLYVTSAPTSEIIQHIEQKGLFAVTISPYKQDFQQIVNRSKKAGKPVYVHTYNEVEDFARFRAMNVDGLYTDFLYPLEDGTLGRQ